MRLGIIARADLTGLGVQSRNWVRLLNPQRLVVINSTIFNRNEQHLEWYDGRGGYIINGFIKPLEINPILNNLDAILTFEIPYNYELIRVARQRGVKTIIQNNWEFTDYLREAHLPLPDLLMNHSYWHLEEQKKLWPDISDYCPTPIFVEDFTTIREQNMALKGKRRFLHVAGRRTHEDRNGTHDLLEAMKLIPREYDFELVLKTQSTEIPPFDDPRIMIDQSTPLDEKELYRGFDALIMPRRYGGACLPMTEALTSGMPVIMPNIDPNNKVLPEDWLVMARPKGQFMTRTMIDLFSADHNELADKIIDFATITDKNMLSQKQLAYEIALKEYSSEAVKEKWTLLLGKTGL
jgi:hypothetical protein